MALSFGGVRSTAGRGNEVAKPTGYDPAYGGIPNLPPYVTDTSTVVGEDVQAQMQKNLPGYGAMTTADTGNIQSNLAGTVNQDVIQLLQQQAAERGVSTGLPGAPITDAAYLRALGLTSLQLQQLGHTQLTEAMARTPIQRQQTTTMTRDLGEERAIYASAPNPRAAAEQAIANARMGMGEGQGISRGPGVTTINPAAPSAPFPQQGPDWNSRAAAADAAIRASMGNRLGNLGSQSDPYGSLFDYGLGGIQYGGYQQGGFYPSNTSYNPETDQSQYNYGLPDYYGRQIVDDPASPMMNSVAGAGNAGFSTAEIDAAIFGYPEE